MAEHDTPTAESGAHSDATGFAHVSVMRDEIVEVLSEVPDGIVVDATLGGAGHAAALLAANDGISILGLDRDEMALAAAGARLAAHGDRVTVRHTRFDGLAAAVQSLGAERLSGALFDLGVSSPQLAATPDTRLARPFRRSASKSTTSSPCSKVRSPRLWICSPRKAGARC